MLRYGIIYILLLFLPAVETRIPFLNYWDEAATLIILILCFADMVCNKQFQKSKVRVVLLFFLILCIGLAGNTLHKGLQNDRLTVVKDVLAFSKYFIIVCYFSNKMVQKKTQRQIVHKMARISKVILVITAAVALVSYFLKTSAFYTGEIRMVKCFRFVFTHPTFFVSSYVIILSVLIADSIRNNRLYIVINLFLLFLAQRTKGYIVIFFVLACFMVGESKIKKTVNRLFHSPRKKGAWKRYLAAGFIIVLGWLIGRAKIIQYFSWGMKAARPALYIVGLRIASSFFPFGAGFGTFASSLSGRSYSKLYDIFSLSSIDGLQRDAFSYMGDVFWPYVYGQIGFIGCGIYLYLMLTSMKIQIKNCITADVMLAVITLWVYALFASLAEAYFTNSSGVQFALVAGLILGACCCPNHAIMNRTQAQIFESGEKKNEKNDTAT